MEQDVRVAGDTADIETEHLLVIKRCPCHIAFCNYKCIKIGLFHNGAVFYTFIYNESE
jgi:hypothetical protein